ncbi:sigma-54-dependent Fis family transcriptional regulator [Gordonia sp. SCSIO 19800]|uniref:sigma-54-dependent Fis family transcriptional regulator n=1 Tax=Gordonia sp. SCSIO 19800 TaxID=2826926 RepID=UPI002012BA6B|nr:helix-turn-helix domain-containing protein [Gordonia sp. SCSIO 19800]
MSHRINGKNSAEKHAVPALITQSWNRSKAAGLTPEGRGMRSIYVEDLDLQRRMVQCAVPVLNKLHDDLAGMPLGIALTDERAQVMLRRDVDRSLKKHFEAACFSPGFDYSESIVGTNGVGTAIETGMAVYVHGDDHFKSSIRHFTCAGAPIHNPLTGRLEGLIDISSLAKDANPLMRQLAIRAARDIQESLKVTGSAKQQLILSAFLAACRRPRVAVFSLGCGVFMSNEIGAKLLDPVDEAYLREEANSMLAPMSRDRVKLVLPSGLTAMIRRTLVEDGIEAAGVILEVEPIHYEQPAPAARRLDPTMPGVAGRSEVWRRHRTEVATLAATSTNALILGEPGSGRATVARGAHLQKNPLAQFAAVDATAPSVLDDLRTALGSAATSVALLNVDTMSAADDAATAEAIAKDQVGYPARWIVATGRANSDWTTRSKIAENLHGAVEIPALRHHPDDIPDIIQFQLTQLAPSRTVDVDAAAIRALRRYHWPANVTELVAALRHALRVRPVGTIGISDFPASLQSTPRRSLTTIETVERDAIVTALNENGGNRLRAAESLGISRSSLYRKISTYGIHA